MLEQGIRETRCPRNDACAGLRLHFDGDDVEIVNLVQIEFRRGGRPDSLALAAAGPSPGPGQIRMATPTPAPRRGSARMPAPGAACRRTRFRRRRSGGAPPE